MSDDTQNSNYKNPISPQPQTQSLSNTNTDLNAEGISPNVGAMVLYEDVTISDFFKQISDYSQEERTLALTLIKGIQKVMDDNGSDIASWVILSPIIAELLKIVNATTGNKIKALDVIQKAIIPKQPRNVVMNKVSTGERNGSSSEPTFGDVQQSILDQSADMTIFKDEIPEQAQQVAAQKKLNINDDDDNPVPSIIKPKADSEVIHSSSFTRKYRT